MDICMLMMDFFVTATGAAFFKKKKDNEKVTIIPLIICPLWVYQPLIKLTNSNMYWCSWWFVLTHQPVFVQTQEEMALQIAQMIISDVNSATAGQFDEGSLTPKS